MATKKYACFILLLVLCGRVDSASLLERSYEYFMNLGKSWAPNLMSIISCIGEEDAMTCAKEKAGKLLDSWDEEVQKQRRSWQEAADAEVIATGRSIQEMPSKLGSQVEDSLNSLVEIVHHGVARALAKKHDSDGGIDTITISTGGGDKKKMKKKKPKPAKIHLVHPVMMTMQKEEKGAEVQLENGVRNGRGIITDLWDIGEEALDAAAEHAMKSDESEDGISDKSSLEEQRGKKKKKKKAILKLLILGAVLKAKIGTLLQILSFKLQVKFFLIALIGLGINLARLWIDIKNKHHQQPQKVIYYEHAQHQHHYDHEEDHGGWGPWSRSIDPEDTSDLADLPSSPYHAQERQDVVYRPLLTKD